MKAWEIAQDIFKNAHPVICNEEEQTWTDNVDVSIFYDNNISLDWGSHVPGSGAPEKIMVAAVQALENRGYQVSEEGYRLLREGLQAHKEGDFVALHQISARLRRELALAKKDETSPYWSYTCYDSFEQYEKKVAFPEPVRVDFDTSFFREQIQGAWLSQLIGGAMGTMVEGYTSRNLREVFGDVTGYLREPNTYNDDITFELAFLDAFSQKGYDVTGEDIALSWVGYIPCGWSAEEMAIRNIKNGIFPPESGRYRNPFNEWIGAQMRSGICGMAAPGDPHMAARLAWSDAEVSHANNGILGGVFNAVMTSLAFVDGDIRSVIKRAISMIPSDSQYYSVVSFAWQSCENSSNWQEALSLCMEQYRTYNWIHAYPNACCEIIALYFGAGDYRETLHIVTMCGVDVDCNAGMIMPILAIQKGMCIIPQDLIHPAFSEINSYMRGRFRKITMEDLVSDTLNSIKKANTKQGGTKK